MVSGALVEILDHPVDNVDINKVHNVKEREKEEPRVLFDPVEAVVKVQEDEDLVGHLTKTAKRGKRNLSLQELGRIKSTKKRKGPYSEGNGDEEKGWGGDPPKPGILVWRESLNGHQH